MHSSRGIRVERGAAAAALARATTQTEDGAESRVYVNNMNTAHPTVTIPHRSGDNGGRTAVSHLGRDQRVDSGGEVFLGDAGVADGRSQTGAGAAMVSYSDHSSGRVISQQAAARDHAHPGAKRNGVAQVLTSRAGRDRSKSPSPALAAAPTAHATDDDLGSDEVHPNLELVYARVMRRLQRELNYDELNRVSLADQYGVAADMDEGGGVEAAGIRKATAGWERTRERSQLGAGAFLAADSERAEADTGPWGSAAAAADTSMAGRTGSFTISSVVSFSATHPLPPGHAGGDAGSGQAVQGSMIVRYGRRQTGARGSLAGPPVAASATSLEEAEQAFASQPCPWPLRLVIQHVQETLMNKMAMAERGNMRDCLRLAFESRALLDRLLKEAPTYVSFPENPDELPSRRSVSGVGGSRATPRVAARELQEMFQEFRKKPVLLPRAVFTQDEATGAVGASLEVAPEAVRRLPSFPASAKGGRESRSDPPQSADFAEARRRPTTAVPSPPESDRGHADRPSVSGSGTWGAPLPSVGNSLSLTAGADGGDARDAAAVTLPASYGMSTRRRQAARSDTWGSSRSSQATLPLSRKPSTHTVFDDRVSQQAHEELADNLRLPERVGRELNHGVEPLPRGGASITAGVSTVSVGTLTEENAANTITRERFEQVQRYAADLEVQLGEARGTHAALGERLLREEDYGNSRKRVMAYLRETLVRECNMLRSQLHFAAQKEQQLQHALKEKQQQLSYAHGGSQAGGPSLHPSRSIAGAAMSHGLPRSRAVTGTGLHGGPRLSAAPSASSAGVADANVENSCSQISTAGAFPAGSPMLSRTPSNQRFGSPTSQPIQARSHAVGAAMSPFLDGALHQESSDAFPGAGSESAVVAASTAHDITAIQSVLDLVLLAVENDEVFPPELNAVKTLGTDVVRQGMSKDLKRQADVLRATFEEKSKRLQDSVITQKIRNNYVLMEKEKEIERLKKMVDLSSVEASLRERVKSLRSEQRKLRNQIHESLQTFHVMLNATVASVINRAKLMDQTASDNTALHNTQEALKDLVESAYSLFAPMLTPEYARGGYHPWPLKLRNTTDPFAQIIHSRYGPAEVVRLREQLSTLSDVYVALHSFVTQQATYPDAARPTVGEPLRLLCAGLALHPRTSTDVLFEVRQRHDRERQLQRAIAKINFALLWNVYRQRAFTERSVAALAQAGMDPYTTTLPVGRRVNTLAAERGQLTHERNTLLKERVENAKHVYRLWREKSIDIYEGCRPPQAAGLAGRLTVLAGTRPGGARAFPHSGVGDARSSTSRAVSLSFAGGSGGAEGGHDEAAGRRPTNSVAPRDTRSQSSRLSSQMPTHGAQSYLGGMVDAPMTGRP